MPSLPRDEVTDEARGLAQAPGRREEVLCADLPEPADPLDLERAGARRIGLHDDEGASRRPAPEPDPEIQRRDHFAAEREDAAPRRGRRRHARQRRGREDLAHAPDVERAGIAARLERDQLHPLRW
ncbi:MAG TPA: hypothetical protein VF875_07470 [Anaeromyxobacter sp.]